MLCYFLMTVFLCQQTMKRGNCDQMFLRVLLVLQNVFLQIFICLQCHNMDQSWQLDFFSEINRMCKAEAKKLMNWTASFSISEHKRLKVGSDSSCPWPAKGRSKWIQLIRCSKKSLSSCAAALYKHLELENPTCQVSSPPQSLCHRLPLCPLPPFKHHTWVGIFASDLASICVKPYRIYPPCLCSFSYDPTCMLTPPVSLPPSYISPSLYTQVWKHKLLNL